MPRFSRYINCSERKQLWSILLVQITLVTLSWYFIETMPSNNECYKILGRDYTFYSPYIVVPNNCTCWTIFWFRINRYTMYTVFMFIFYVFKYEILLWHLAKHTGLAFCIQAFNVLQAGYKDNIFYRDGPLLFPALFLVVCLEKVPFEDNSLNMERAHINLENEERLLARGLADSRCWNQAIWKIRQCDNYFGTKQIIQQADEQIENNQLIYQLLVKPKLPPLCKKKTNVFIIIFIHVSSVLLMAFVVWNAMLIYDRPSFRPPNRENITRIL